jgi:hypothetical protein
MARHSEWERGVKASTLSEYRSVVDAHIVRHCFGSLAINALTILEVKEAMGHAEKNAQQDPRHVRRSLRAGPAGLGIRIAEMDGIKRVRISIGIHGTYFPGTARHCAYSQSGERVAHGMSGRCLRPASRSPEGEETLQQKLELVYQAL